MRPRSVVVVGASERAGSLGAVATRNLLVHSGLEGPVTLVNSRGAPVLGRPTITAVEELDRPHDVAIVAVGREHAVAAVSALSARRTGFAVVVSSGYAEVGGHGAALQDELLAAARRGGMRLVGPNSPGVANVRDRIGLTIQPGFADELVAGPVGLISQSGGLTRGVLQSMHRGIGFSGFFSLGNQCDLDIADYVHHFAHDPETRVIAAAVEGIPDTERFARAVAVAADHDTPVVLLKVGRSSAGRRAASSHTGSLVGAFSAARAHAAHLGVVLVDDIGELAIVAAHLARSRPRRGGVAVYGLSGGAGVLASDALGQRHVPLAELAEPTVAALRPCVAVGVEPDNPVDVGGPGLFEPAAFAAGLRALVADDGVGLVLVTFNAWYDGHTRRFVDGCREVSADVAIPVVPVWTSERRGPEFDDLDAAGLPAVMSFSSAASVAEALLRVTEGGVDRGPIPTAARALRHRWSGRAGVLDEAAAMMDLESAGLPTSRPRAVGSLREAAAVAEASGYPVVLKASNPTIPHREGLGFVSGPLPSAAALGEAWESVTSAVAAAAPPGSVTTLLLARYIADGIEAHVGVGSDPEWGPVVSVGLGGRLVEWIDDSELLAPSSSLAAAAKAIERTRLAAAYRARWPQGQGLVALADVVRTISAVVARPSPLVELDLNPVVLTEHDAIVVDALAVLSDG